MNLSVVAATLAILAYPPSPKRAYNPSVRLRKDTVTLVGFLLCYATMVGLWRLGIPRAQASWVDPTPGRDRAAWDPALGSLAPEILAGQSFPIAVVVHTSCLTCGLESEQQVKDSFARDDVLNVVAAAEDSEYRRLSTGYPKARILYVPPSVADDFGARFGPRLYIYNAKRELIVLQPSESKDFGTYLTRELNDR